MSERGMKFFNEIAQQWDEFRCADRNKIAMLMAKTGIQPGQNVLDVGCGTGVLTPHLKAAVGEGRVTAIDFAVNMIAKARENNRNLSGIEYVVGDINEFMPGTLFDAVVCLNFFPHIDDKEQFILKMKALLKENGIFVIMHDISRETVNSIHKTSEVVKRDRLPACSIVGQMIAQGGFKVVEAFENDAMYFIRAMKMM